MRAASGERRGVPLLLLLLLVLAAAAAAVGRAAHTNNWAVLVDTSRYWFNYRHVADTLSFYHTVKLAGIPDSQIILMLADDMACNPRNSFPGHIFNSRDHHIDLYGQDIEVDFRGADVTVENFIRVLTNRQSKNAPKSHRLLTDETSNIIIYMAGHGGDQFLKFQDQEEISSQDLADTFEQMSIQKRFNEILFVVDTCQASTLHTRFRTSNVMSIGSSAKGENSYSHHSDTQLGVSVIDRFTFHALEFLEKRLVHQSRSIIPSLKQFFDSFSFANLRSNVQYRDDLADRLVDDIPITDFFSAVTRIAPTPYVYPITPVTQMQANSPKIDKLSVITGDDSVVVDEEIQFRQRCTAHQPTGSFFLIGSAVAVGLSISIIADNLMHKYCIR